MKWTTPLLLVVILALAGFAFRTIFLGTPETPREVCTRLEEATQLPGFDKRSALRSLGLGLKHPTARADPKLTGRLLRLRADIHLGMNAYEKARSDVERMQALLNEEDVDLELEAIQLQARTGQTTEALRRIADLAERHPDAPSVSTLKGRLEAAQALQWNQEALKLTDQYLVKSEATAAYPIIDHLCAQHTDDPRRTRLLRDLHGFFSDTKAEQLGRVLDLCKRASTHYTAARSSYARGLEKELTIPGLAALLDLLVKSGRSDLVVDLGVASRVFPEILRSPGNLLALMDAMELLGQKRRIGRLVSKWPWSDASAPREFYEKTSQVLYNAELFSPLRRSGQALRSFTSEDLITADFYMGVVSGQRDNYKGAMRLMERFLRSGSAGPVKSSRSIAYRIMAKGWAEQNRQDKVLRALQGVIDSKGVLVADDFLKLAEAQLSSSTTLPILPEENWTHGMRLAPHRIEELMPKWEELGKQTFKTFGQDFDRYYRNMVRRRRSQPRQKVGPYTLYRIGQQHLAEDRHQSALAISKVLLRSYPDLLPALELRILALQMAKSTSHLGPATVIKRLRLAGPDAKSRQFLSQYPSGRFAKFEQLELVRLDPYGIGRTRMAHWLYEQGLPERALQVLRPVEDHQDPPALRALRLKALMATEHYDQTIEEAASWVEHPSIGQLCIRLTIRAHLANNNPAGVMQGLRSLLAKGPRKPNERRKLAQDLIGSGMLAAASPILERMDQRRGLRTPSLIEWRALCASNAGQPQEAQELLTRALPFFDDGRIDYLQVVMAAGDRDWPSLPLRIQRLEDSDFAATPFQAAGIALLGERLRAGIEMAQRGVQRNPNSLSWALLEASALALNNSKHSFSPMFGPQASKHARALLMGTGDLRRDPRDSVAMLLALEMSPWQAWTEGRAKAAFKDATPNLWLAWLVSEAQFRSGRLKEAHASSRELIQQFPLCAPLWNHLFKVLRARYPDDPLHPEILAARADQMLAVPLRRFLSPAEVALGLASQAKAQGHPDQAMDTLQRYLQAVTDSAEPETRWMLGRMLIEQGRFSQGLQHFDHVLLKSKSPQLHPWVPEYLDKLDLCHSGGGNPDLAVGAVQIADNLESLVHRYPKDPKLALARLSYRVKADQRSALLAADEALASLEMLQSLAPNNSIDELRPQSSRAWMEYLLSISPLLGEEYCRKELDKSPGNLDMWIGLSYALQTQGRIAETRALVSDLLKISDDPELHYRLASLLAHEGQSAKTIQAHLVRADQLSGIAGKSPRRRFIQAQTTLLHGAGGLNNVVKDLADLWPDRDLFSRDIAPLELGRVYLMALVLRHHTADLRVLDTVAEEMLPYIDQDPYAEDLIRSFRAVGHSIEARLLENAKN